MAGANGKRRKGRGRGESKFSPRRIEASLKALKALDLRRQGLTYEEIKKQLKYNSREAVFKGIMTALRATQQDVTDEFRENQYEKYEELRKAVWPKALEADPVALIHALTILIREDRLYGVDTHVQKVDARVLTADITGMLPQHMKDKILGDKKRVIDALAFSERLADGRSTNGRVQSRRSSPPGK
jgi:hypothetical protein